MLRLYIILFYEQHDHDMLNTPINNLVVRFLEQQAVTSIGLEVHAPKYTCVGYSA